MIMNDILHRRSDISESTEEVIDLIDDDNVQNFTMGKSS